MNSKGENGDCSSKEFSSAIIDEDLAKIRAMTDYLKVVVPQLTSQVDDINTRTRANIQTVDEL